MDLFLFLVKVEKGGNSAIMLFIFNGKIKLEQDCLNDRSYWLDPPTNKFRVQFLTTKD